MTKARLPESAVLDGLRRSEFGRLDAGGHVNLDYTGAGLYADSLIVMSPLRGTLELELTRFG